MILVVDDEEDVCEVICTILESANFTQIHALQNPLEAISEIRKHNIKVAIVDIGMKELNGMKLMEQIYQSYPKVKMICVSGFADMFEDRLKKVGVKHILTKPYKPTDLINAVSECLGDLGETSTQINLNITDTTRVAPDPKNPIIIDILGETFLEILKVQNMSITGLAITAPHGLDGNSINKDISIIVSIPKERPFKAKGTIKHVGGDSFGVEFKEVKPEDIDIIKSYIKRRLKNQ
jgi:CheY-like chemotaxis protein